MSAPVRHPVIPAADVLPETAPAALFVQIGTRRFQVESIEQASVLYCEARDRFGEGASQTPQAAIVTAEGIEVARISYNGNVWPPQEWTPDMQPLFRASICYLPVERHERRPTLHEILPTDHPRRRKARPLWWLTAPPVDMTETVKRLGRPRNITSAPVNPDRLSFDAWR